MDPIALLIVCIGVPFALGGYMLTRSYCKAVSARPTERYSHRAAVFNSAEDDLRAASDGATIAACLVASTVIHP